jgi:hypothetical protein
MIYCQALADKILCYGMGMVEKGNLEESGWTN